MNFFYIPNLAKMDEEMEKIREVLINYPYVAMVNSMANCFDSQSNSNGYLNVADYNRLNFYRKLS